MVFFTVAALLFFALLQPQQIDGRLIITLEEPSPENNILIQVGDSATNQSKRIDLVPGRTFHLHCCEAENEENRCDGNNLLTAVWYSGNDEIPAISSASDPNHRPMVYTSLENNRRTLVLTNFTLGNVGIYRCRERGTSNTEGVDVVIGAKNPTVIPASETVVLREGNQGNSRPVLIAFISGKPYPSALNITWLLNNHRNLPSGIIESGPELLLPGYIRPEIAGVYTCRVTTSAGSDSANISVSVIYQPSVSLSTSAIFVEKYSTATLSCRDSRGVPPPTFVWMHNGSNLTTGDHISREDGRVSNTHYSNLTIRQFQRSLGGEYRCIGSNDAGSSYQAVTLRLPPPSPPSPPTNIHVTSVSACSVRIEWAWPRITDDEIMVHPDYVTFEMNFIGESDWTEIGTADVNITRNSLMVGIPWNGVNTNFRFRSRCVSYNRGPGEYSTPTDTFTAYSEAALLSVLSLSTRVLSSSTIQVSWTQSEQDCFDFTPFIASCTPAMQINVGVSANAVVLESSMTVANITSLDPDTTHNCSVTSQLRGNTANDNALVTIYGTQLATTYPKFGAFRLLLTEISDCEEWIKESAAAKRDAITMGVAEGIEELCQCGFNTTNIQMGEIQCSLSSQTAIVYRAEVHSTPGQTSPLPQLFSLFQEWISREPQLLVDAQPLRVDGSCSAVPASAYNEEACGKGKVESETHWTEKITSTYGIVGIAGGSALILLLCVTMATTIFVSRHRKTAKLQSLRSETKEGIVPSASNAVSMTDVECPYYERMDLYKDSEPQYESLDEYDKLASCAGISADKLSLPQPMHADCPVYVPTGPAIGNSS